MRQKNIYVALVLLLRQVRQKTYGRNYHILKIKKIWRKLMVSNYSSLYDVQ